MPTRRIVTVAMFLLVCTAARAEGNPNRGQRVFVRRGARRRSWGPA